MRAVTVSVCPTVGFVGEKLTKMFGVATARLIETIDDVAAV